MALENDDTGETIGTGNDARVAMLNSIGDNADRERGEDFVDINDDGTTSTFEKPPNLETEEDAEVLAARQTEETEAARVAAEQEEAAQVTQEALPQKHRVKVNGREIELTTEELYARVQKVESADEYLREAARIRNEQIKQQLPAKAGVDAVDRDLALVRAIQMGTEEEAVAAIREFSSRGPSQDDLRRTVDEQLTFKEAISKFRSEYSDISSDPVLNKLAADADAQLLAQKDSRPYYERYQEIGEQLRAWKKGLVQPTNDANLQSDKLARKVAAPVVPKAAAGKTQTSVQEEKEESASEIVAAIAKSRGGPQWMSGQR